MLGNEGSSKFYGGMIFIKGEIVVAEVDLKAKMIKFTNRMTNCQKTVKISFWPEIDEDQYYFCVGRLSANDKATLIAD